jgi:hypothetical protein
MQSRQTMKYLIGPRCVTHVVYAVLVVLVLAARAFASSEAEEQALPLPPRTDSSQKVRQIKFGEKVRVDDFGPVIINADCSTSYIENWDSLTQSERETSYRRIGARNRERHAECQRAEREREL